MKSLYKGKACRFKVVWQSIVDHFGDDLITEFFVAMINNYLLNAFETSIIF